MSIKPYILQQKEVRVQMEYMDAKPYPEINMSL